MKTICFYFQIHQQAYTLYPLYKLFLHHDF